MANYALLAAGGKDRPGIVAGISRVLYEADCNIEDSAMSRLGGTFACMLMLRLPEGLTGQGLEGRLDEVKSECGLWVHMTDLNPAEAVEPEPDFPKHTVEVRGADRKGMVHQITALLASQSVNITNLLTHLRHGQTPWYGVAMEVEIPHFVDPSRLDADLQELSRQMGVEIKMAPGPAGRLA